jgi:hypothetical protein
MSPKNADTIKQSYFNPEKNQEVVIKLFNTYYRSHNHTGKIYEDLPDMFLVKPETLMVKDLATRNSDKIILEDCIQRAHARNGYINVSKFYNAKLNYYWLELNVSPFMLGDAVNENNQSEFFFLITRFVEYVIKNPNTYGDLTAELDSDKDLALMLKEINKLGDKLRDVFELYPEEVMVAYNPKWPVMEVNKLLMALKGNELSWCEVFAESLIYVMGRKT